MLADRVGREELENLLRERVVERFARLTGLTVLAVLFPSRGSEGDEKPPANPLHPACAAFGPGAYCRESWQLHVAALQRDPQAHWHECDLGLRCAIVPLVWHSRCRAAFKLVCPNSMAEEDFEERAELLDILVQDLTASAADVLARSFSAAGEVLPSNNCVRGPRTRSAAGRPEHPQVRRAVEYIEEHLREPGLTVARVARELEIHSDYLANLFTRQIGRRTTQYINDRRIEMAKTLLTETDWLIKRVAHECGFAHSNWFCHVFKQCTGHTPSQHRRIARRRAELEESPMPSTPRIAS